MNHDQTSKEEQQNTNEPPRFAIVTGASSDIRYELAKCCAQDGCDLLVAADEPIETAAAEFREFGVKVDAIEADLATTEGVDRLYAPANGRTVDALLANTGHGLGEGFLDQDFDAVHHLIDTNVTGTLYLIQKVRRDMPAKHPVIATTDVYPVHSAGSLRPTWGDSRVTVVWTWFCRP